MINKIDIQARHKKERRCFVLRETKKKSMRKIDEVRRRKRKLLAESTIAAKKAKVDFKLYSILQI